MDAYNEGRRWRRPLVVAGVAVTALAAGAGAGYTATHSLNAKAAETATVATAPSGTSPTPSTGPGSKNGHGWHRFGGGLGPRDESRPGILNRDRQRVQPAERRAEQAKLATDPRQRAARDEPGRQGEPGALDPDRLTGAGRDHTRRRVAAGGKPPQGSGVALEPVGDRGGAAALQVLGQRHVPAVGADQDRAPVRLAELVADPGVGHRTVPAPHVHLAQPVLVQDAADHDGVGHGAALPAR